MKTMKVLLMWRAMTLVMVSMMMMRRKSKKWDPSLKGLLQVVKLQMNHRQFLSFKAEATNLNLSSTTSV